MTERLTKAGYPKELFDALCTATEFSDLRRQMNLNYLDELKNRLPTTPQIQVPLFKEDIEGLTKLDEFRNALVQGAAPLEKPV
jgi:anion-transporting  ArsA/GET3 family ATPase